MEISEKQDKVLRIATHLLMPYDKEDVSAYTYYFERPNEKGEFDREYDTCDSEKCIEESKANIRKNYGKGTRIEHRYYSNDGDHEHIEICSVCYRPLNRYLTWVYNELEYYSNKLSSSKQLKSSRTAFDLTAIFNSMPSCDEKITPYDELNAVRYKDALLSQKKFVKSVVRVADNAIKKLFPLTKEELNNIEEIGLVFTISGKQVNYPFKEGQLRFMEIIPLIKEAKYIVWNGTNHEWINGFLVGRFHAKDMQEVNKKVAEIIDKKVDEEISAERYAKNLKKKFSFKDSIKAGNCEIGTLNFIKLCRLDKKKKYTGEFLLRLVEKHKVRKEYFDVMVKSK